MSGNAKQSNDTVGFCSYFWGGKRVWVDQYKALGRMEQSQVYLLDTNNLRFLERKAIKTSFIRKMWKRIKSAWSTLRNGNDYCE